VDKTARLWPMLPDGKALVDLAETRFRCVAPSTNECTIYSLDCSKYQARLRACARGR